MLVNVVSLAFCHLRRLTRKREWRLLLGAVTLLIAGLASWGRVSMLSSTLTLLAASLAAFVVQAIRDRDLGFSAGLLSTGMPETGIYLSRILAATALFVTLCVLRSAVFYIL